MGSSAPLLRSEQFERYRRHLSVPEFGFEGQRIAGGRTGMAKKKYPDSLRRRLLIEQELDPARALQIAEAYLEEDRGMEAVAFLVKANARERLVALQERAVGEGDPFLLREVSTALGQEADAATWRALAEAARAGGKDLYAAEANRQAARLED